MLMIQSFRCKKTQALFEDEPVPVFKAIERSARRKLLMLNEARTMEDVSCVPGNRLEMLSGKRKNEYSIRINQQWRLTFKWSEQGPFDVAIEDYH